MPLKYGSVSIESIRFFLKIWPEISGNFLEIKPEIISEIAIFRKDNFDIAWSHFYELPLNDHVNHLVTLSKDIADISNEYQYLSEQADQLGAIPETIQKIDIVLESQEFSHTKELAENIAPTIFKLYCLSLSIVNTFKSVAVFGKSINELLELARADDDSALFDAIRIDKTVIGSPTAAERIARAEFFENVEFFEKLKKAMYGKLGSRENKHYQRMRIVFNTLYEVGATQLSDEDLYELFVKELKIYPWDAKEGGNAKALRKFADTYMKKNSTT